MHDALPFAMVYDFAVVKTLEGDYQCSLYRKAAPDKVPDFPMVIMYMIEKYNASTAFAYAFQLPRIVDLPPSEENAVRTLCDFLTSHSDLKRRVVSSEAPDDTDIPF
jgi:hypothetical protein